MTIAEFKLELATLIKKGSLVGLSSDAMADKLIDAAESLTSNGGNDELAAKFGRFENDPAADVIASHRS